MNPKDTIAIVATLLIGKLAYTQDELEEALRKAREIYALASPKEEEKCDSLAF